LALEGALAVTLVPVALTEDAGAAEEGATLPAGDADEVVGAACAFAAASNAAKASALSECDTR
jgi:hypothetical protein